MSMRYVCIDNACIMSARLLRAHAIAVQLLLRELEVETSVKYYHGACDMQLCMFYETPLQPHLLIGFTGRRSCGLTYVSLQTVALLTPREW